MTTAINEQFNSGDTLSNFSVASATLADRWDQYVESHSDGTFFHLYGWKSVIEESFGHVAHYLYVEEAGVIQGVLPLVHVKSLLFGNSLISTPFCACGGVLADNDDTRNELYSRACQLAEKLGVGYLEVRGNGVQQPDWPSKDLYVNFSKSISADHDENLTAIPRKQRAMVRKGIKAKLDSDVEYDIDRFYSVYAQSFRNLGTPVFSKKFFHVIKNIFSDKTSILTVSNQGEAVSSVLSFYYKDQVLPYFGGGIAAARSLYASDFMYWDLMCRSADQGIKVFDYGRSKRGTGSFSFKKNWGFEPQPLSYEYYLVKATDVPNLSPTNPKYRYFIQAWKRLPMPVANTLGPLLARNLG